ncbi:hypothetical protein [Microcoleus sp. Pol10D4]
MNSPIWQEIDLPFPAARVAMNLIATQRGFWRTYPQMAETSIARLL